MEEAGIIMRETSEWGARTKFPPKKPGSDQLQVVHNFILVNDVTIKLQYPTHRIDKVLETMIWPEYTCFFIMDASNGYWAIPIRPGNKHKTGIVTLHGQYLYLQMRQGLKRGPYTYTQFIDLVFGPFSKSDAIPQMDIIIGTHVNSRFSPFMDNYIRGFSDFDAQFKFLHEKYFL